MKTRIQSLSFLATLAIALGMISWGSALNAQSTPPSQQTPSPEMPPADQQTPSPEMPPADQQTPSSQSPSSQTPSQTPDATQPPDRTPDSSTPQSGAKDPNGASAATGTDSQTFSGTVVKQGDKYVLKDDTGKTYDIDHQTDVAKFEGKRVRVQGTLDPSGNKIMVK